jgi:alkylation response protein AidB-like acyl-CoA dehydrogenase
MGFSFTNAQLELRDRTAEFVRAEIPRMVAKDVDQRDEYPHELMKKLGDQGFWRINIPEEYGGEGGDIVELMIFTEEIAKALPVLTFSCGNVHLYGNNIIKVNGSQRQQQAYLPRLAEGQLKFAFALTEPGAGSDAANIRMSASREGCEYVINGSKIFTSGASVADITISNTRTAPSRYGGLTSFLVDTSTSGYSARPLKKLGSKGSDTCEVHFQDIRVSPDDILGGPECLHQAWPQMMRLLNGERLVLAATCIGSMETVINECIEYVRRRKRRSGTTLAHQICEHKIAEMATSLEASRQLMYSTATMMVNGVDCVKETSMCKYFCAENAKKVCLTAMEVIGGDAYEMDSCVQQFLRDISLLTIGGGTSQIQKNVIAKQLGL